MSRNIISQVVLFVVLLFVQALVLNNIHLFDCATPLLYVYMPMLFWRNYPRAAVIAWSFVLGLCLDVFSNTPGLTAASMTLIALIQPYLLELFVPRESPDDFAPSIRTMGFAKFSYYALIIIFIYCLVFFSIEAFNFFNWVQWLACIGGSTALTFILVLVIENFRSK